MTTDGEWAAGSAIRRWCARPIAGRCLLVVVVLAGASLRLARASSEPLEKIEEYEFIPAAMTLSAEHLPLRIAQHGALPAYLLRAGSLAFGTSTLGFRVPSVIAGSLTIILLYCIGARWWGRAAGLIAAVLLTIDRYHVTVSSRAIDLPFDLAFVALTMYCVSRFLDVVTTTSSDPRATPWLYGAAASAAGGFLCKEFTALLLPAIGASLVLIRNARPWLRRRTTWMAVGLFAILIAPDVYSSLTMSEARRADLRARHTQAAARMGVVELPNLYREAGMYMTYGDQLSRFGGLAPDSAPFHFYFGDIFEAMGVARRNEIDEFPYMHPLLALVIWTGFLVSAFRSDKDSLTTFLLTMAVVVFVPFTITRIGAPRDAFPSDATAAFYWVDRSMLAMMLLTGQVAARAIRPMLSRPNPR